MSNKTILQHNENSNPYNRRNFFKNAAFFGAAASVPAVLVQSCTEQKTSSSKEDESNIPVNLQQRTLGKGRAAMKVSALGFALWV